MKYFDLSFNFFTNFVEQILNLFNSSDILSNEITFNSLNFDYFLSNNQKLSKKSS